MSIPISTIITFVMSLMKTSVGKDVGAMLTGTKPKVHSRRFVGNIFVLLGAIATAFQIDIPAEVLTQIADNVWTIVSACGVLWGALLTAWGTVKAKKEE